MKLKQLIKEYWAVLTVFVLCAGVVLLFCTRKEGMFIDEIYTYGLSNSDHAPYLSDLKESGLRDTLFTHEDIDQYLTVGENDRFAFSSVYYNQSRDVHPPLYYWLFNLVSSFFPHRFSKWIGLGINTVLFMLCLIVFYRLVFRLFENRDTATAGVAVFGMCVLALSMVMMIRMYTLLTLFTLLLMDVAQRILKEPDEPGLYVALGITVFCGFLTQYYFAFYAFFLCISCGICFACRGQWKVLLRFFISAGAGLILMIIVFPASIRHLFIGNGQVVGGSSVLQTLKETAAYGDRIETFWKAKIRLKGMKWILAGAGIGCVLLSPGLVKSIREKNVSWTALLLAAPAVPAFLLVAVVSPVTEQRYIYNLIPGAALFVCFVFSLLPVSFRALLPQRIHGSNGEALLCYLFGKLLVCGTLFAALWSAKSMPPDNLFTEQPIFNELCSAHAADPCVYITDGFFAPVTQDLGQLRQFRNFFTTDNVESVKLREYIGDADEVVLYIDVDGYWSSGYDADTVIRQFSEANGFTGSRLLYQYSVNGMTALSETYILSR